MNSKGMYFVIQLTNLKKIGSIPELFTNLTDEMLIFVQKRFL